MLARSIPATILLLAMASAEAGETPEPSPSEETPAVTTASKQAEIDEVAFHARFDTNDDGTLDAAELRTLEREYAMAHVRAFHEWDRDRDGGISQEEFSEGIRAVETPSDDEPGG